MQSRTEDVFWQADFSADCTPGAPRVYSLFNDKYEILNTLDQALHSSVYIARSIGNKKLYTLKIYKQGPWRSAMGELIDSRVLLEREAKFLQDLDCRYFPKFHCFGIDGKVNRVDGSEENKLLYLMHEYFEGSQLEEIVSHGLELGENMGRHVMT